MTNEEAIKVLEEDKTYLYPDECYNTSAYDKAIKLLEKEAKREERRAKIKAEKEKIEALATVYEDLKEGELFRITSDLKDKRVYRRDRDGSTQIVDSYGNRCNYKSYPYLTMIVYKV